VLAANFTKIDAVRGGYDGEVSKQCLFPLVQTLCPKGGEPTFSVGRGKVPRGQAAFRDQLQQSLPIWIGGQGTVAYEQNTQQSPFFGVTTAWQDRHS
jgi:hypothetical protein